jgi:hypothetical protein
VGSATRLRTRAMSAVMEARQNKWRCSSWNCEVLLSEECMQEIQWWILNLVRVSSSPICPRPFDASINGYIFSDASDSGSGAVLFTKGPEAAASSVIATLSAAAPAGLFRAEIVRQAFRGLKFTAPPPHT